VEVRFQVEGKFVGVDVGLVVIVEDSFAEQSYFR